MIITYVNICLYMDVAWIKALAQNILEPTQEMAVRDDLAEAATFMIPRWRNGKRVAFLLAKTWSMESMDHVVWV